MKMKKSLCCLIAAALLSVTALSGCSGNEKQGDIEQILIGNGKPSSAVSGNDLPSQASQTSTDTPQNSNVEPSTPPAYSSSITPAMWKVEDGSGNYCYMFGTIHAGNDEAVAFPDYFEKAYNDSQAIAVEADISTAMTDPAVSADIMKYLTYSDGTKITDHISQETYNGITEVLKNNAPAYYDHMYDNLTPIAWSSIFDSLVIEKSGLATEKGVDITAINRAKADGKQVLEVESMDYQLKMFDRMSDTIGELLLINYTTQEGFDSQITELNELFDKWKRGDPVRNEIDTSQFYLLDKETREAMEYYIDEMFTKRNPAMADKVESYIRSGQKVLVMVGAAHFYADDGLVNLMRKKGYTVTRISPPAQNETDVVGAV